MSDNKNNVSYMTEYLKYAVEFEKYVYVWSKALNEANLRIQRIRNEQKDFESIRLISQCKLDSLGSTDERQLKIKQQKAARYKSKARSAIIVLFVLLIILFIIGCGISIYVSKKVTSFGTSNILINGAIFTVVASILTGILPVCLIVFFINKNRSKNIKESAYSLATGGSTRRQRIILDAKRKQAEKSWSESAAEERLLCKRQKEIQDAYTEAKNNLARIYSENVLPIKYRTLNAVATLYEYLETGRCNYIQGHGGIYDTYDVEKIHLAQLEQMVQINETLSRIEDNQRYICQELRTANQTLSNICSSLNEIEKTNAEIAKNTEISAVANQQTAEVAKWMKWNTWANGY